MRTRIFAVVAPAVLAGGLVLGATQFATGSGPSLASAQEPADAPDAKRPVAATHTEADLYGVAQAIHHGAAGAAQVEAQLEDFFAKLAAAQAEEAARAAAARRSGGGGGGGCGGDPLECIKQCESHGDYGAVSANGQYRGAYQFSQSTWESVGGTGDPAAAPPEEQDYRAQVLYSQAGSAPWGCG